MIQPVLYRFFSIVTIVLMVFQTSIAKEPQKAKSKSTVSKGIVKKQTSKTTTKPKQKKSAKTTVIKTEAKGEETSSQTLESIGTLEGKLEYISQDKNWKGSKVGIAVYSLTDKELVFSKNYKQHVTPASLTKLFTTFAALEHFGANYTVPTEVYVDKAPENGIIKGNVYVYGTGDPKLSFQDIEALAEKIQQKGVKKIEGSVCADGSFFDKQTQRAIYSGDNEEVQATPAIRALCLENPSVSVVASNNSAGNRTTFSTIPPSSNFVLITTNTKVKEEMTKEEPVKVKETTISSKSKIQTKTVETKRKTTAIAPKAQTKLLKTPTTKKPLVKSTKKELPASKKTIVAPSKKKEAPTNITTKKSGSKKISQLNVDEIQLYGDYYLPISATYTVKRKPKASTNKKGNKSGISIQETTKDNTQFFTINGSVAPNRTVTQTFPIRNVEATIAGVLHNRLESGSVTISGGIDLKHKPQHAILLTSFVRPFSEIINIVNKNSNNYFAEQVFKMIGGSRTKEGNTANTARKIIKEILEKNGIHDTELHDGSGLSRRNLVTPEALITMLKVAKSKKFFKEYYNSMTIAGVDGTTRSRMKGTCAEGNCHAKTGTLRNASGLAGYVTGLNGKEYVFAIISNGNNVGAYKRLENSIVQTIANYKSTK